MMLYPPVADLVNKVGSSYALVNLVAKRARVIAADAEDSGVPLTKKAVSAAIEEVYTGKLTISERPAEPEPLTYPEHVENPEYPVAAAAEASADAGEAAGAADADAGEPVLTIEDEDNA